MITLIDEDNIPEQSLFTWLLEQYFGDDATRNAARRALGEVRFVVFTSYLVHFEFPGRPVAFERLPHSFVKSNIRSFLTLCSC